MDCIINFAPTGMIPTRAMTPHVPVAVEEIVEQVLEAAEIGITMVHLHARDEITGAPTCQPDTFGRIISSIREHNQELVIVVTLSGRTFNEFEMRRQPLLLDGALKPDMGSLTLSSVNFNRETSVNSPDMITALAAEMQRLDILPELEVFDSGMINYAKYLEKKGLLSGPHYFNFIFGNVACAQAELLPMGLFLADLPPDSIWSMGGIGDYQLKVNSIAVASGGGVRVGIEDNIWYDTARTRPARNIDLIRRIHALAEIHGREIMRPSELRKRLHLLPGHGQYGRAYQTR
jgi:uncharacterized protein (DUF849 family)